MVNVYPSVLLLHPRLLCTMLLLLKVEGRMLVYYFTTSEEFVWGIVLYQMASEGWILQKIKRKLTLLLHKRKKNCLDIYFSAFANLQDSIIALHFLSMSSQPSMLEFVGKRRRKNALTVEKEVWIFTTTTRYLLQSIFAEFNHIKNRYQRVDVHIRSVIDRVFHLVPFFTTKGFFLENCSCSYSIPRFLK